MHASSSHRRIAITAGAPDRARPAGARAGRSIIEVIVGITVAVVLLALLVPVLSSDRAALTAADEARLVLVHRALATVAADEPDGALIRPSVLLERAGRRGATPDEADTTANVFSALIAANAIDPEMCVSPCEPSDLVAVKADYDFGAIRPGRGILWDESFRADLARGSNVSDAHVPLYGRRMANTWTTAAGSDRVVLGNRGVRDGADPGMPAYRGSVTLRMHGSSSRWSGHLVFGDGHVELVETFALEDRPIEAGGTTVTDNVFRSEPRGVDPAERDDAFLAFTRAIPDDGSPPIVQWD